MMISIHYQRTERGNLELDVRQIRLTARQRALLLLIESGDNNTLIQQQLISLATTDNIQTLLDYQFITPKADDAATEEPASEQPLRAQFDPLTKSSEQVVDSAPEHISQMQWQQRVTNQSQELPPVHEALSFEQIKNLMVSSLKSYCGLLAFGLMRDIQQASRMAQLRMCQMQWVTLLSESKADAMQVKYWVNQINYSYQKISKD